MNENEINYYAIIPANVRYDTNLKPNEKLLYGEITALSNQKGFCYAQNQYFAKLFKVSNETVSRWISHLYELGYVNLEIVRNDNKEIIKRKIFIRDGPLHTHKNYTYPIDENINTPIDKKINTLLIKKSIPIDENVKENNIIYNIDDLFYYIINNNKEKNKIFTEFNLILQKLELNYESEILKLMTKEKVQTIKEIVYVIYLIYNSEFRIILGRIKRQEIVDMYFLAKENNPDNFINYYKKSIINKYS